MSYRIILSNWIYKCYYLSIRNVSFSVILLLLRFILTLLSQNRISPVASGSLENCLLCPSGSYCIGGTQTPCAAGSYSSSGQSSCTTCPIGTICASGSSSPKVSILTFLVIVFFTNNIKIFLFTALSRWKVSIVLYFAYVILIFTLFLSNL